MLELGQTVMTAAINDRVAEDKFFAKFIFDSLIRHTSGDWGDISEEDKSANVYAMSDGGRIFSSYAYGESQIWIITEADKSATTILFPDEY